MRNINFGFRQLIQTEKSKSPSGLKTFASRIWKIPCKPFLNRNYCTLGNVANSPVHAPLKSNFKGLERKQYLAKIISASCIDKYEPEHQNGPDYVIPTENIWSWNASVPTRITLDQNGIMSKSPISLVTTLKQRVAATPDAIAFSIKRQGEWVRWSFDNYLKNVQSVAKGFIKLGLERFHGVGIMGSNAPEWMLSAMGAIFAGGLVTGIYTTTTPHACQYILENSTANIIVIDSDEQLKKILEIKEHLPHLKAIVQYLDEPSTSQPDVFSWSELLEIGNSVQDAVLEKRIKSLAINQCCSLVYTSGTTGIAKGVMLNHDNISSMVEFIISHLIKVDNPKLVSYLPLSHISAQVADMYAYLRIGELVFAPPDALKGTLVETIRDVRPEHFIGVPRVYEKMNDKIKEVESQMGFTKRKALKWATGIGLKYSHNILNGKPNITPFGFPIANKFLLKIKSALGLDRTLQLFCGGAPVCKETLEFFLSLNVLVTEGYGLSETGVHIVNTLENYRLGSVGKPGVLRVKVDRPNEEGHGEVCLKGRNVFMGYLRMQGQTEEALDEEGWLHSGDFGRFDENGFLYITGRMKELLITSGGINVAPFPIEEIVKEELPIISHAVLIGDKRNYLSLLMTLKTDMDMETLMPLNTLTSQVRQWCLSSGSNVDTMQDILQGPNAQVMVAIQKGIDRVNQRAATNATTIKKWKILPQDFCIPTGELGPTMKIKRKFIMEKYKDEIEALYR